MKEAVVKGLGFHAEDFRITGFDVRDAMVGRSVAYEFEVEIDNKVLPFKLLEDVNRWEYVDLPIFRTGETLRANEENGLVERRPVSEPAVPVLAPFQLAGPMELWIHDAKDMRLSLPVSIFIFLDLIFVKRSFIKVDIFFLGVVMKVYLDSRLVVISSANSVI